jgi:hypothetical protein
MENAGELANPLQWVILWMNHNHGCESIQWLEDFLD